MMLRFSLFLRTMKKWKNMIECRCFSIPFNLHNTHFQRKSFKKLMDNVRTTDKNGKLLFLKSLVSQFETSFNYIWKILRVDDDFHGTFQLLGLHIHTLISQIFKQKRRYALITKTNSPLREYDDWQKFLCIQIFWVKKKFFYRRDSCPKTFIHTIKVGNQHLIHTSSDNIIYLSNKIKVKLSGKVY